MLRALGSIRHHSRIAAAAALGGIMLTVAACGGSGPAPGASGETALRRSTSSEPKTLDPQMVAGNSGAALMYDMFEGLLAIDAAGNVRPGMAERFDLSPDGLTYTFHLRDGLKWSDGTPLTSDDFVYSFRRSVDPKAAARAGRSLFRLANFRDVLAGRKPTSALGVTAPDPRTVVITLDQPAGYMEDVLSSFAAMPVPRHAIEKFGEKWTAPGNMVTNGPYMLKNVVPNTYILLAKNPNYYEASQVSIPEIYYYSVEKPATALTRFKAGELDIVFNVPPSQLQTLRREYAKELRSSPIIGVFYVLLNNNKAPTNNPKVREALSLAVDRNLMSESILRGEGGPATGIVPDAMPDYTAYKLPFQGQSMEERKNRARALLAEAGYTKSNPLKITYKFGGQEANRPIAVALQSMWSEIGVDVTLENVGASGVIRAAESNDYQAMRYTYYAPYSDPVAMLKLLEGRNVINYSKYANPAFDKALDEADKTLDQTKRRALLEQVEAMAMADHPVIPVYYYRRNYLVSQNIDGWVDNVNGEHLSRYLSFKK